MSANIDFDKSGIWRQSSRVDLGPSIGWVDIAGAALTITAAATIAIPFGVSLVNVNVAGAVVIELPSARGSLAGALAIPSGYATVPITIADIGGFADAHPITIQAAPGEAIGDLASIAIIAKFGAFTLRPNISIGQWSLIA
jgi:hypothetical protein